MSALVIDAGVAVAWYVSESEGGPANGEAALALLAAAQRGRLVLHAPQLLLPEVGNVFWKLVRFRELAPARAARDLTLLRKTCVRFREHQELIDDAFALATATGSTVYDGMYMALAQRLGLNLITTDTRLVNRVKETHPWVRALSSV